MRDCTPGRLLGVFSKVSGIVSPDVAPLTTVKRRLVVFALELGAQYGDTSVPVSWPSINILLSLILSHPTLSSGHVIFRITQGHQFTYPFFRYNVCALSQRCFGLSHFNVKRSKFTLTMSCAFCFLFVSPPVSLSLLSHASIFSYFPYWICLYVASALSPRHFHKLS